MAKRRKARPGHRPPATGHRPPATGERPASASTALIPAASIAILGLIAFAGVFRNGFINYDDHQYVFENPVVLDGLTAHGVRWAFTTFTQANWHPLTWLSHMLDVSLFGANAGMHHGVSLVIHLANSVLLFLLLRAMTGSTWRSAFAGALFAVHPLHVESVAWASERKDVLSTLFGFASLLLWVRWVRDGRRWRYAVSVALFACSLMSKPTLVTLPIAMLLLDWWPLSRLIPSEARDPVPTGAPKAPDPSPSTRLRINVIEKAPYLALSIAGSIMTVIAQRAGGAVQSLVIFDLPFRLQNALRSYLSYLAKAFWPSSLAIPYPYDFSSGVLPAFLAAVALAAITAMIVTLRRRAPYLPVGWLWFLGTLVPTIGLVQVGTQAMADRYMYVPLVGLAVAVTWGVADVAGNYGATLLARAAGAAALIALTVVTTRYVALWRDSITLFTHSIAVTRDNSLAESSLGHALMIDGRPDEAVEHLREAARTAEWRVGGKTIRMSWAQNVEVDLGSALLQTVRRDPDQARQRIVLTEAADHLQKAAAMGADSALLHNNLASAMSLLGDMNAAIANYRAALRLAPDDYDALMNLGAVLSRAQKTDEAAENFRAAARVKPDSIEPQVYLALTLAQSGRKREAADALDVAVRRDERATNDFLTAALRMPPSEKNARDTIARLRTP